MDQFWSNLRGRILTACLIGLMQNRSCTITNHNVGRQHVEFTLIATFRLYIDQISTVSWFVGSIWCSVQTQQILTAKNGKAFKTHKIVSSTQVQFSHSICVRIFISASYVISLCCCSIAAIKTVMITCMHVSAMQCVINSKKRQSLLNTVVIGHQRYKTANIKWGGEDEKGSQWKDPS